jgi:hypothetical protein
VCVCARAQEFVWYCVTALALADAYTQPQKPVVVDTCAQTPELLLYSPCPAARTLTEDHTSRCRVALRGTLQNVGRQGRRQAVPGHGSRRRASVDLHCSSGGRNCGGLVQDLGGWQDDHAEKDLEQSQRGSRQEADACPFPLEQELLGRHPQWHGKGKVPVRAEATPIDDSLWCLISTLELPRCGMEGQDAERLAEVLAQCPALAHLDLSGNSNFGAAGTERLAGVLGQYRELVHLNLSSQEMGSAGDYNYIGDTGAESLAGVLAQCTALTHLDLSCNRIDTAGTKRLAGVLAQCAALAHLNLCWNDIDTVG